MVVMVHQVDVQLVAVAVEDLPVVSSTKQMVVKVELLVSDIMVMVVDQVVEEVYQHIEHHFGMVVYL